MSKALAIGYNSNTPETMKRGIFMDEANYRQFNIEKINGFTFYYNPKEITLDYSTRKFLENFRTDDGEDCFTLARDNEGLVIY